MNWLKALRPDNDEAEDLKKAAVIAARLEQVASQLEQTSRELAQRVAELRARKETA